MNIVDATFGSKAVLRIVVYEGFYSLHDGRVRRNIFLGTHIDQNTRKSRVDETLLVSAYREKLAFEHIPGQVQLTVIGSPS